MRQDQILCFDKLWRWVALLFRFPKTSFLYLRVTGIDVIFIFESFFEKSFIHSLGVKLIRSQKKVGKMVELNSVQQFYAGKVLFITGGLLPPVNKNQKKFDLRFFFSLRLHGESASRTAALLLFRCQRDHHFNAQQKGEDWAAANWRVQGTWGAFY